MYACQSGWPNANLNEAQQIQQQTQYEQKQEYNNYNNVIKMEQKHTDTPYSSTKKTRVDSREQITKTAYTRIVEQPASKALRFRYECEISYMGTLLGQSSTVNLKTYPTIEIVGYKGRAIVVVSCVTKDAPYRPHPHNLVGKENCKKGVCTMEINCVTMRAEFNSLGIQCTKRCDVENSLKIREDIRVDPFKTGFSHKASIDLSCVRLCFQVFLEDEMGRFTIQLPPVVSEPIYDKKSSSDLNIIRVCSCSASVLGDTNIILMCERVVRNDIAIRFFEEKNNITLWQAFGVFEPFRDVHKQTAIVFRTPRYHKTDITEPVQVYIQLQRPSDGAVSQPLTFEYLPAERGSDELKRKRRKLNNNTLQKLQADQGSAHFTNQITNSNTRTSCQSAPAIQVESTAELLQPQQAQYTLGCEKIQQQQIAQQLCNNSSTAAANEAGPTASELLELDSGQLMQVEEQYLLQLTTEELRLSNLSIH